MHLRRNKLNASYLTITLTPADTYTMTFTKIRKFEKLLFVNVVVAEFSDVYCDQLAEIFTRWTGMYTHF
jgi:hypothetical protein